LLDITFARETDISTSKGFCTTLPTIYY
jgi:hypothetical protein